MIKIVHKSMSGVSNMADQGRIILQNYCVCNHSMLETTVCFDSQSCNVWSYNLPDPTKGIECKQSLADNYM